MVGARSEGGGTTRPALLNIRLKRQLQGVKTVLIPELIVDLAIQITLSGGVEMTNRETWSPFSDLTTKTLHTASSKRYGLENFFGEILPPKYNSISCIAKDIYRLQQGTGFGMAVLTDCTEEPFVSVAVSLPCEYDKIVYANQNMVLLKKDDIWTAFLIHSRYCTEPFECYLTWGENFLQTIDENGVMLYHLNQDILLFKNRHTEYEITSKDAGFFIVGKTDSGLTQHFCFEKNKLKQIR